MSEPDIYVERCSECPMHNSSHGSWSFFYCGLVDAPRTKAYGRRFPRWCPLLKGPITIAARRKP